MKLASVIFNCISRRQSVKPDAFDARLLTLAAPERPASRRRRVAVPSLFRCSGQAAA